MTDEQVIELCLLWEEDKLEAAKRYKEITKSGAQMTEALFQVKLLYKEHFQ